MTVTEEPKLMNYAKRHTDGENLSKQPRPEGFEVETLVNPQPKSILGKLKSCGKHQLNACKEKKDDCKKAIEQHVGK